MIRIGIIGDIGSGKSHVAKLFGCPVFNADKEVIKIYEKNKKCYNKLKKSLPNYVKSFPINKNFIIKSIIDDDKNLKKIVKIIHPEIKIKMKDFLQKNKKEKLVVLDIPLLLENKINNKKDFLVFVDAPKKIILRKLKKRENINFKIINKFRKIQLPLEIKKRKSNFIIKNNFNNNSTKKSVKKVLKKILLNDRSYSRYRDNRIVYNR